MSILIKLKVKTNKSGTVSKKQVSDISSTTCFSMIKFNILKRSKKCSKTPVVSVLSAFYSTSFV